MPGTSSDIGKVISIKMRVSIINEYIL